MASLVYFLLFFVFSMDLCASRHASKKGDEGRVYKVVLIGDSLIYRAERDFALTASIAASLPQYQFNFTVYAVNSKKISDIKDEQLTPTLDASPDAV